MHSLPRVKVVVNAEYYSHTTKKREVSAYLRKTKVCSKTLLSLLLQTEVNIPTTDKMKNVHLHFLQRTHNSSEQGGQCKHKPLAWSLTTEFNSMIYLIWRKTHRPDHYMQSRCQFLGIFPQMPPILSRLWPLWNRKIAGAVHTILLVH